MGIGTATPTYKLDIKGVSDSNTIIRTDQIGINAWAGLRMDRNSVEKWFVGMSGGSDNLLLRRSASSNDLTIDTAGNVGIGTTSPSQKLTVAGTVESTSGGIKFPDGTVQTTAAAPTWHQIISGEGRFVRVMNNYEAVLDRETGLVWEESPSASTYSWSSAITYCRHKTLGGRKGWRLPTVEELLSLVDPAQNSPALPSGHLFDTDCSSGGCVDSVYYWAATTIVGDTTYASFVDFGYGGEAINAKTYSYHAWCVRGGQGYDAY
jgi:hypothetical protein